MHFAVAENLFYKSHFKWWPVSCVVAVVSYVNNGLYL